MAKGFVHAGQAPRVWISIFGFDIDAVVDTGFDGGLQLPDALISMLPGGTQPTIRDAIQYANGTWEWLDVYDLSILIDGETIDVKTIFSPVREAILGVEVLQAYKLVIDFPAGTVELTKATP